MRNTTSRRSFLRKATVATTGIALLSSTSMLHAFTEENCPFEGYNPFAEEKTDLRTSLLGKHVRIKGTIYDTTGLIPVTNATIEVWHLSPNSTKYKHRGKLKTNEAGEYTFITDFPNRAYGKSSKIYFKVGKDDTSVFTELILDQTGANITSKHWEENQQLGEKLLPTTTKFLNVSTTNFNISI